MRSKPRPSLRRGILKFDRVSLKLSIIILVFIMAISSFTGIFIYYQTKEIIIQDVQNSLTAESASIAEKVNALFEKFGATVEHMTTDPSTIRLLKTAKSHLEVTHNPDYRDVMISLNATAAIDDRLSLVWIASEKGNFFVGSGGRISRPSFEINSRGWYAEASASDETTYSQPYLDAFTGRWVVSVAHRIQDQGTTIGYVAVDILLDTFPEIMKPYHKGNVGYHFLIDANREIIYYPGFTYTLDRKFPDASPGLQAILTKMMEQQTGVESIQTLKQDEFISYAPIPLTKWSVAVSTPTDLSLQELNNYSRSLFFYFTLCILVTVIVTYLLLAYYLQRFPFLTNITQKFITGEAIINQNDYAIIVVDSQFRITYFSKTAEKMLGYTSKEVVNKESIMLLQDQDTIARTAATLSAQLGRTIPPDTTVFQVVFEENHQTSYDTESLYVHKNGTRIPISVNVNKMLDHNGNIIGYIRICRDISEQKRDQVELMDAKKAAESANQAKSAFLAMMSHELRTPLNGIIGLTQLIQKTGMTPIQQDYLRKILASSQTLLRIINEILDFSKIEAGKIEIEETKINLYGMFDKLSETSSMLQAKKDLVLLMDLPNDWPAYVLGDPLRLEQVLLNLISNAIKFTNYGMVCIRAENIRRTAESIEIKFSIIDTGIGISEEQQRYLFEPFSQADNSTSRKYGGTGLGLVISKKLVDIMQGDLQLHSEFRVGSTFSFTIPLRLTQDANVALLPPVDAIVRREVLLVSDKTALNSHMQSMLHTLGHEVYSCLSWKEATNWLEMQDHHADIVILDMDAADMYGEETWVRMQKLTRCLGVLTLLMTTTPGREAVFSLPDQLRPDAVLLKPVQILKLHHILSSLFDNTRYEINEVTAYEESAAASSRPYRILLAEDHEINQQIAVELLESRGYSVGVAENGRQVLMLLEPLEWDLILMDIHMPEMDGLEATKRIRSNPVYQQLPIIAMSANIIQKDRDQYFEAGMNDMIQKPIDVDQMFQTLDKWLGSGLQIGSEARKEEDVNLNRNHPYQILEDHGIMVEQAIHRLNGKVHILNRMLTTFHQEYKLFMDHFMDMIEQEDHDTARRMIHTLKGTAGNLSAQQLYEAANQVERWLKDDKPKDDTAFVQILQDLTYQLTRILHAIELFIARTTL